MCAPPRKKNILSMNIKNSQGRNIPLTEVARIKLVRGKQEIKNVNIEHKGLKVKIHFLEIQRRSKITQYMYKLIEQAQLAPMEKIIFKME
ncbi:MAG: Cu/Ag efflux pump CusA [bacterium]|jgi:Cu/Ag efflux pump CusA